MKKQVQETFDKLAGVYERMGDANNLYNTQYERPAMMKLIASDLSGLQVLDAGCSAGWYSQQLADKGAKVTSVDMSPEMVNITKKLVGDRAEVLCLDLEEPLPFAASSYDMIVSSLTLHYLKNWKVTFSEFSRILKPGGSFIFSIHHPLTDLQLLKDVYYFSTELIVDEWHKEGKTYEVPFYRRPLSDIFNALLPHFAIEEVVEPKPTSVFKEFAPDQYEKLIKIPNFLILKISKK
ncbi:class I SAM-dependent methyltransferase [Planococcus sp. CPCC 101016]|uniref:class I SAM-dependent methyltransferase n=1 Tax=Planococcus sp. CPCC 101016 TaxID=2599617 RepID=UPI0011B78048|nr:class I SAM-dependent methyltransferase [Planococcus sp. CPCC 101016]TWT07856.1 class I SAM-dependent methyltransferase [Planococcus sp. CPCC 101016]